MTAPDAQRMAALEASHRELVLICEDFVRKVESGEARSTRTYAMMVNALANARALQQPSQGESEE